MGQSALPTKVNDVDQDGQSALPTKVNDVEHDGKRGCTEQDLINKTQENKREGARARRPPAPAQTGDSNLDHPAVKAYRDAFKLTPNALQRAEIAGEVTDVATWQEVLRDWQLASYKLNNIPGMLDKYRKAIRERSGAGDRHAKRGQFGLAGDRERRPAVGRESPAEAARLDAEWDALVRGAGGVPGVPGQGVADL
jgi:hypothetical protein